jgi:GMP synthase-like glutamine amidotransferase
LAQLIAHAFGQRVYRFGGLEVDYPMVLLTAAGWTDPLFQGLAPEQRIMQMSAAGVCASDAQRNQAFRIGASIYGIQARTQKWRGRTPRIFHVTAGCDDAALR